MSQFNDTPVKFWLGKQRTGVSIKSAGVTYEPPIPYFTGAETGKLCPATFDIVNDFDPPRAPTNAPSGPPTVPRLAGVTTLTTVPISFNKTGVTGLPPLSFGYFYGTNPLNLTTKVTLPFQANADYNVTVSGLNIGTAYYFASFTQNPNGIEISAFGGPYSTADLNPTSPPVNPPTVPDLSGSPGFTSMILTFNTSAVGGNPTPDYRLHYGTNTDPTTFTRWPYQPTATGNGNYAAYVNVLTAGQNYWFFSEAVNAYGSKVSGLGGPYRTAGGAPSQAPTVPALVGVPTGVSMRVSFDVSGVYGAPPIIYKLNYGLSPTTLTTTITPTPPVSGTLYTVDVSGLTADTSYYFQSDASNNFGASPSNVSSAYTTAGGTPVAPSKAPVNPVLVSATNTSLTVTMDVSGVTGVPTPTYGFLCSTANPPTGTLIPASPTGTGGSLFGATITGLTPGTNYFLASVATNSQGTATSTTSGPFKTYAPPPVAPQAPTLYEATRTALAVIASTVGIPINASPPDNFFFLYGLTSPPTTVVSCLGPPAPPQPNQITQVLGSPPLTPDTPYYVMARVSNIYGTADSPISVLRTLP